MRRILTVLIILSSVCVVFGRRAADFFTSAPEGVVPLVSQTTRLDLYDYYKFGSDKSMENRLGGECCVISDQPNLIEVQPSKDVVMQIGVIPVANDTLIAVVTTVKTPAEISDLQVFDKDWEPKSKYALPSLSVADWSLPGYDGETQISTIMPFVPIKMAIDTETEILVLTNTASQQLSESDFRALEPFLIKNKKYKFSAKRLIEQK